jgi:TadE-like protein
LRKLGKSKAGEGGAAAVELAVILPTLLVMVFGVVDLGRLIQARLIVTNVSREGGSLVSRGFSSGTDLLNMLQSSGAPLDLNGSGKIYVSKIKAGTSINAPNPTVDPLVSVSKGGLSVSSKIGDAQPNLGLSSALYDHLTFEGPPQNASDIQEVWVVEVYYNYRPITPLPKFIKNILITPGYDGNIIESKSVF